MSIFHKHEIHLAKYLNVRARDLSFISKHAEDAARRVDIFPFSTLTHRPLSLRCVRLSLVNTAEIHGSQSESRQSPKLFCETSMWTNESEGNVRWDAHRTLQPKFIAAATKRPATSHMVAIGIVAFGITTHHLNGRHRRW